MDIDLARTFLAVVQHGSFKHAAGGLHCTQSTVTARIQNLEQLLGRTLFIRNRAGATPTADGRRFQPYAERFLHGWREAQQALGLPSRLQGTLRVAIEAKLAADIGPGVSASLLPALPHWAIEIRDENEPDADIRIGYGLVAAPGRTLLAQRRDPLILVATTPRTAVTWDPDYRAIDWGHQFRERYARHYPFDEVPQLHLPAALWSLTALIALGGAAYFPERWCAPHLAAGTLQRVTGAKQFDIRVAAIANTDAADWLDAASAVLETGFADLGTADHTVR